MSEREANGWHTIEIAEENGQSLVEAYLGKQYRERQAEWGREYGRAVFEAWPAEGPDLSNFVEERITALEATVARLEAARRDS